MYKRQVQPRWDTAEFPKQPGETLPLLVAGNGEAPLFIHQDAYIYGGVLKSNTHYLQAIQHQAYILISKGKIQVNDLTANAGDALEITNQAVEFKVIEEAELILIDAPKAP